MSGSTHQVCSNPIKKSLESGPGMVGVDRISRLPDGVISDILSLRPIKDAVRTCVLSKRWESEWMSMYNVKIDAEELFSIPWSGKAVFVKFVERILLHLLYIRSFHLTCKCCGEPEISRVETWLSAVLRRNVESVELGMQCDGTIYPIMKIPSYPPSF